MLQYTIAIPQNIETWIAQIGNAEAAFFAAHPYLIAVAVVAIIAAIGIGLRESKVQQS